MRGETLTGLIIVREMFDNIHREETTMDENKLWTWNIYLIRDIRPASKNPYINLDAFANEKSADQSNVEWYPLWEIREMLVVFWCCCCGSKTK